MPESPVIYSGTWMCPPPKGGELRAKTTLFVRSLGASGRMPESPLNMERVMGIEPTLVAWEATVLPLNYTRVTTGYPIDSGS